MKEIRLGVIGCTTRGYLSDLAHKPADGVRVVAGADIYPEAQKNYLERFKKKFPDDPLPTIYTDYREMIEKENLDGVFITTPDFLHEEMAVFALEHKIPVYLEKPMAITIAGCDRIMEAAYRNRTKLMIGHNMRYMTFTTKIKEVITSGLIGEVKAIWCRHFISYGGDAYFRDWHADETKTNSLLLQKGAHDIDIIHWFANSHTVRVSGVGNLTVYNKLPRRAADDKRLKNGVAEVWKSEHYPPEKLKDFYPEISVNDLNMITMTLENGVLATYQQCHYTPDASRNYTVIGTRGRVENYGGDEVHVWTTRNDGMFTMEGDIKYRTLAPAGTHGGADPQIVQSFVDAIRGKYSECAATVQDARNSVACGCQGADSIRQNGIPLDIPPIPEHLKNWDFTRAEEIK